VAFLEEKALENTHIEVVLEKDIQLEVEHTEAV